MKIPQWIFDDFYNFDKNRNGTIEQSELDELKGSGTVFDPDNTLYKVSSGMNISLFIQENRRQYGTAIQYTDNEYTEGRKVLQNNQLMPTNKTRRCTKDKSKSIQVEQGEFAVKTYSKDTPSMQTYNVCSCVAVTIYDKATKRGFMAHIDKDDRAESLEKILKSCKFNPETSEVRIIGGWSKNSEGTIEIVDEIVKKFNLKVVEYDVLGESCRRDIQLDLNTGEVFDYDETTPTYKIVFDDASNLKLLPNEQSE